MSLGFIKKKSFSSGQSSRVNSMRQMGKLFWISLYFSRSILHFVSLIFENFYIKYYLKITCPLCCSYIQVARRSGRRYNNGKRGWIIYYYCSYRLVSQFLSQTLQISSSCHFLQDSSCLTLTSPLHASSIPNVIIVSHCCSTQSSLSSFCSFLLPYPHL